MAAALSYPGVYIEEVPSGVRTITGVPTSIAAFIGRARRGPTNKATLISSYADFERIYGGLWLKSQLGYAVRDFFLNGGGQAVIVRLYRDPATENPALATKAKLTAGGVALAAISEGQWGGYLRLSVDKNGTSDEVAGTMGVDQGDLFNITVSDASPGGRVERFLNLTVKESPRRIDRVLAAESQLVNWDGVLNPSSPPTIEVETDPTKPPKSDPVTAKQYALTAAQDALTKALIAGKDPTSQEVKDLKTARDTAQAAFNDAVEAALTVSDGRDLSAAEFFPDQAQAKKLGLYALEQTDLFNILCIPPYRTSDSMNFDVDATVMAAATAYCEKRRAMYIIDSPSSWDDKAQALAGFNDPNSEIPRSKNAALFFPRVLQPNPLREDRLEEFGASGLIAGIFARTDTQRGVWKAPAGTEATLVGVSQLAVNLTDLENGDLNKLGVNCLRAFPATGRIVWGSRTLRGNDQLADEWKYIPVRRTALFIEESLYRGTQWVVFEPNDEPLWAQIRLNVGAFMQSLFRQGAFAGQTPRDAYLVKCDKETTTPDDVNRGVVNIVVGFAPLKPAEFVVIKLQQLAGQTSA